jgi:hypothetical protein
MKNKGFENGNVVPIVSGNVQSYWTPMPDQDRQRDLRTYHVLTTGAMNMRSYSEWAYQDKKERAAKIFGSLAAKLRAKQDAV